MAFRHAMTLQVVGVAVRLFVRSHNRLYAHIFVHLKYVHELSPIGSGAVYFHTTLRNVKHGVGIVNRSEVMVMDVQVSHPWWSLPHAAVGLQVVASTERIECDAVNSGWNRDFL